MPAVKIWFAPPPISPLPPCTHSAALTSPGPLWAGSFQIVPVSVCPGNSINDVMNSLATGQPQDPGGRAACTPAQVSTTQKLASTSWQRQRAGVWLTKKKKKKNQAGWAGLRVKLGSCVTSVQGRPRRQGPIWSPLPRRIWGLQGKKSRASGTTSSGPPRRKAGR